MDDVEFIAFDLETTGFSPDFNRIVEVGAVRFRSDGTEVARMKQLVDPRCAILNDVTEIHGINRCQCHTSGQHWRGSDDQEKTLRGAVSHDLLPSADSQLQLR